MKFEDIYNPLREPLDEGPWIPSPEEIAEMVGESSSKQTLVVNLYGGPGTGKSTNASATFAKLKIDGITAELAHEYAKDLMGEGRDFPFTFQPYVIAKQMFRVHRWIGKVDVIVTDSPILLGLIYDDGSAGWAWQAHVVEMHKKWNTLDIFLRRDSAVHPYSEIGRRQTEEEALTIDQEISNMLLMNQIPYEEINVLDGFLTAELIVDKIKERLNA